MSYNICTPRCCNVCFGLEMDKQIRGELPSENPFPSKMKKCGGCKLVLYCSREHQRIDWKLHRDFCCAIKKLMKNYEIKHPYLISGQPYNIFTMERAILQVKYVLRQILKRELEFYEEELTSFPAHCEVCFSFDRVYSCHRCYATSYCSAEHFAEDRARHKKRCRQLQIYYCPYNGKPRMPSDFLIPELRKRVPNILRTDLVGAYECISGKVVPKVPTTCMDDFEIFSSVGDFSCMGTILLSLEFLDLIAKVCQTFKIFILGATMEQDLYFSEIHTRWFFLQYQKMTRLELYFIGPDVVGAAKRQFTYSYQGTDRTVVYESHKMLYQEFKKVNSTKPSFIIIFNCGFSEHAPATIEEQKRQHKEYNVPINSCASKDTWSGGISEIIKSYNLPIVFTSLTRLEAILDFAAVQRVALMDRLQTEVRRLFDVKVNPYRDISPLRNWKREYDDDIFFRNGYVQGVTTRLSI